MNTLISIGYTGCKSCYLNISKEEAVKRYCKQCNIEIQDFDEREYSIRIFEFEDEFSAYDIWEII